MFFTRDQALAILDSEARRVHSTRHIVLARDEGELNFATVDLHVGLAIVRACPGSLVSFRAFDCDDEYIWCSSNTFKACSELQKYGDSH